MTRHFFQCRCCRRTWVREFTPGWQTRTAQVVRESDWIRAIIEADCPYCGHEATRVLHHRYMGQILPAAPRPGRSCVCDARCTHARGPHCDCSCGGANHGAGLVMADSEAVGSAQGMLF